MFSVADLFAFFYCTQTITLNIQIIQKRKKKKKGNLDHMQTSDRYGNDSILKSTCRWDTRSGIFTVAVSKNTERVSPDRIRIRQHNRP